MQFFVKSVIIFKKSERDRRGCELKSEWEIAKSQKEWEVFLCKKFNISPLLAHLLANRGADSVEKVEQFLMPDKIRLDDPYKMLDMDKAVEELLKIREKKEPMVIYGDYDVDGVTGTSLYYLVLKKWGWNVKTYIPKRLDDGYGLSKDSILALHNKGMNRLITVDCGITSVEEIEYANSLGCKVIVTDHHEVKDKIPPAVAVVDPKRPKDSYPFKDFSGVGVAYKVLQALQKRIGNSDDLEEYLDIVALGTIADIVPILWENRYFVYKGINLFGSKKRVGISKLMELSNVKPEDIKAHDIGYKIAPKINAVGRIDSAYTALKLILEEDPEKAHKLAQKLLEKNQERQSIENQIYQQALAQLDVMKDLDKRRILVLSGKGWHPGVIGIVASRILSIYHRPTLMISVEGEIARGSARSVEGVNIVKILKEVDDLLEEYGGHKMAAGFSLKKELIPEFDQRLQIVMEKYDPQILIPKIKVDAKIELSDVNDSLFSDIERLRPYGSGNPEPIFAFEDLEIGRLRSVGKSGKHVNAILWKNQSRVDAIGFGFSHLFDSVTIPSEFARLDVVSNIWKNSWNDKVKYQLNIVDMDIKFEDRYRVNSSRKAEIRKGKFEKILNLNSDVLIIGDPYIEERVILEASLKKAGRLVVVTPTNSMLRELYNSLNLMMRKVGVTSSYVDALHTSNDSKDVIFTNAISLFKVLKGGEVVILCEPQLMVETNLINEISELVIAKKPKRLLLLSSFLSRDAKSEILDLFSIKEIFHEFHKRDIGIIDDRNTNDKIAILMKLVKSERSRMAIVFSNIQNLKKILSILCDEYPQMCKSDQITSYIPNLSLYHYHRVVDLVKKGKVKVLLTTPVYASSLERINRIVYYDFPRNHISFLKPPSLFDKKNSMSVIHMLFGEKDVDKNIKDIDLLFPSSERVVEAAYMLSEKSEDPEKRLVEMGFASSKVFSKLYISMFEEMGAFDGEKVTRIPTKDEVNLTLREREGIAEKKILSSLKRELMDRKSRDIARIFHNPFEDYAKSSN